MNRQPPRYRIRTQKTLVNGFGALALLIYGWFCLQADIFYLPPHPYWKRSLHGLSCALMVGVLQRFAILLLLPVVRAYSETATPTLV